MILAAEEDTREPSCNSLFVPEDREHLEDLEVLDLDLFNDNSIIDPIPKEYTKISSRGENSKKWPQDFADKSNKSDQSVSNLADLIECFSSLTVKEKEPQSPDPNYKESQVKPTSTMHNLFKGKIPFGISKVPVFTKGWAPVKDYIFSGSKSHTPKCMCCRLNQNNTSAKWLRTNIKNQPLTYSKQNNVQPFQSMRVTRDYGISGCQNVPGGFYKNYTAPTTHKDQYLKIPVKEKPTTPAFQPKGVNNARRYPLRRTLSLPGSDDGTCKSGERPYDKNGTLYKPSNTDRKYIHPSGRTFPPQNSSSKKEARFSRNEALGATERIKSASRYPAPQNAESAFPTLPKEGLSRRGTICGGINPNKLGVTHEPYANTRARKVLGKGNNTKPTELDRAKKYFKGSICTPARNFYRIG